MYKQKIKGGYFKGFAATFQKTLQKLKTITIDDCLLCGLPCGGQPSSQLRFICKTCHQDLDLFPLGTDILLHYPKLASELKCDHIDGLTLVSRYQWPFSTWLPNLKFHHQLHLAKPMAALLNQQLEHVHWPKPDCVVVMPLHKKRLLKRGYNQSEVLAKSLQLNTTEDHQINFKRTKYTEPQTELGRQQRIANLKNAFECHSDLTGQCIYLIDDVITTGTTVNQAARVLKQAGASAVYVLAIAISEL